MCDISETSLVPSISNNELPIEYFMIVHFLVLHSKYFDQKLTGGCVFSLDLI